jgi:dienelactone hydrolase
MGVPGHIVEVACTSDHTQTYALYLPSSYTSEKRWPILYFFDPAGRGNRPLVLYRQLAEDYGFIFAGSNNSRNFSSDQAASLNAIWADTHAHLALDERRTYASGFSGGARVAGAMALGCPQCRITGVIAQGAGYPSGRGDSNDRLLYYFAVGNRDFNWPEIVTIRRQREDRGQTYRVNVFTGSHQWAPPEVMRDAIEWFLLKAMQQGTMPRESPFIEKLFQQALAEAEAAGNSKDPLAQLRAYRLLVSDFNGLKDVTQSVNRLASLKRSTDLKQALDREQTEVREQFTLEREVSPKLREFTDGTAPDPNALRLAIVQSMSGLKNRAAHARDDRKRLIYARAFDDLRVQAMENGQQELEQRHFLKAEACFELVAEISDDSWPFLLLAQTHASRDNNQLAVRDLREAVRRGFRDPDLLETDPRLQVLKSDRGFQELLAELRRQ